MRTTPPGCSEGVVESVGVHGHVGTVTTTLGATRRVAVARPAARACLVLGREPGIVLRLLVVSRRGRVLESCSPSPAWAGGWCALAEPTSPRAAAPTWGASASGSSRSSRPSRTSCRSSVTAPARPRGSGPVSECASWPWRPASGSTISPPSEPLARGLRGLSAWNQPSGGFSGAPWGVLRNQRSQVRVLSGASNERPRSHGAEIVPRRVPGAGVSDSCPLCGGPLVEVRAKAVCSGCGRIVEGCCEGAPQACPPTPGAS
jgi:hypothetical protein